MVKEDEKRNYKREKLKKKREKSVLGEGHYIIIINVSSMHVHCTMHTVHELHTKG